MIHIKMRFLVFFFLFIFHDLLAQDFQSMKYGKITTTDFQVSAPKFDTGANAVIIKDFGKTEYIGSNHGFFSIVFTRYVRVKILNKNGFHAADYEVFLVDNRKGAGEKISEIKGSTYNQENGAIQETKLDPKSIYEEKYDRYFNLTKFTMPALKVGSVYELTYTVRSNYFQRPPSWSFQGDYPCLWSEYEVTIPSMFHYLLKMKGDSHFDINTTEPTQQTYFIRENASAGETPMYVSSDNYLSVSCTSFKTRWVKKNVPVLKEQPYVSTLGNYQSKIYFELNYFQQDERYDKQMVMTSWNKRSYDLLISEDFGFELNQDNNWMEEDLNKATSGALNVGDEIKGIFHFVRDNFHCTNYSDLYVNSSLKDVFKKRSGNVAELNLLLVAMLRHRHIQADPAILSTRDHGVVSKDYTILYEYNYVICLAYSGNTIFRLDASSPFNAFNKLPVNCYNSGARIVNEEHPDYLVISPDSVLETKTTNVVFINDDNGNFTGSLTTVFGDYQSAEIRNEIKKTSEKEYFKDIQTSYSEIKVSNGSFDSLNRPDYPLVLHYDLDPKNFGTTDILYFNPLLESSSYKNPFTAAERLYPVEIPYKIDNTYLVSMEIPKGFQVDELPQSARVKLNENQGMFEYLIQKNQDNIQMRVHLKLNQTTFSPEEYATLRDFYAYVVKKESEQIVFKKIK